MNLSTVATLAGYKSHYTANGERTLCGREASNATSGIDMCKACEKAAAKLADQWERLLSDTRAAETQDGVMQAAGTAEPTYTPNEPVSVYATVKGETEEFEAAHIPNGVPADVDRWLTWAQANPNWTNVRAENYTAPEGCSDGRSQRDDADPTPVDANGTPYVEGCEVESVSRRNGRPLERGMVMRIEDGRPVVSFYGEGDEVSDVRPDLFKITSMPVEPTPVQCSEGHPVPTGVEINAYGMCMNCVDAAHARQRAEYDANLIKWAAEREAADAQRAAELNAQCIATEKSMGAALDLYNPMDDAELITWASVATMNANDYAATLQPLTPRLRRLALSEASIRVNTSPGWTFSGALSQAAKDVASGQTPCVKLNETLMAHDPSGEKAAEASRTGQSWEAFRDAADLAASRAHNDVTAKLSQVRAIPATPTLILDMTNGRTVRVTVGEHSMTIRNGSDVRLRAAFWARGLGYRPERGRAVQWHRDGKKLTAPLALV
jgi:hypothetical protein